jgi:hypothetical protein
MGTYDRANDRAMGRVNGKLAIGFDHRLYRSILSVGFWEGAYGGLFLLG